MPRYEIPEQELARVPAEGGFLTVSNLPYGPEASSILNEVFATKRPDYKILGDSGMGTLKAAFNHIGKGKPLGLFPATSEAAPWEDSIVRLVRLSGMPVIPVYFHTGDGSENDEVLHVRVGQAIPVAEIEMYSTKRLGPYLRARTYALEALCITYEGPKPPEGAQPLAEPEDINLVMDELTAIEDRILFEIGDYQCFYTPATDIPHTMRELARLREVIYRKEGEGTGLPLDTDEYDPHYNHLILWNKANSQITGAYRIGVGPELLKKGGVDAFYTASLVKYSSRAPEILCQTLELGRSIVNIESQKDVLPLKLLLAGLAITSYKEPGIKYCLGPVSISTALPDFYKSLIVYFLRKTASFEGEPLVTPPHPFVTNFLRVDPDALLGTILDTVDNVDKLDRLVGVISDGRYRLPVLVRKYFKGQTKLLDFNVDPLFNNSVDGLALLRLEDWPTDSIQALIRFMPEERQEAVLTIFRQHEEREKA